MYESSTTTGRFQAWHAYRTILEAFCTRFPSSGLSFSRTFYSRIIHLPFEPGVHLAESHQRISVEVPHIHLAMGSIEQPRRPDFRDLKVHNGLLGNRDALDRAWETDGYWYFKDVLDKEAVGRMRRVYTDELERLKVIEPSNGARTDKSVKWNGASLTDFPHRMDTLWHNDTWKLLTSAPPIKEFFTELLGDKPIWLPIVEYRATPPVPEDVKKSGQWSTGIHQDGPYSPGIPFRICWIPLATIDREIGGLALVEGMAEKVNQHPIVNGAPGYISQESMPADRWRTANYEAGDVLLMNPWTPHTGLYNISSRFRLSMDHRVLIAADGAPAIGKVKEVSTKHLVVVDDEEVEHRMELDDDTYIRPNDGKRLRGQEILDFYKPGVNVIAAHDGKKTILVRGQQG